MATYSGHCHEYPDCRIQKSLVPILSNKRINFCLFRDAFIILDYIASNDMILYDIINTLQRIILIY